MDFHGQPFRLFDRGGQAPDVSFEDPAALFEVLEHVPARAGRGEEDDVAAEPRRGEGGGRPRRTARLRPSGPTPSRAARIFSLAAPTRTIFFTLAFTIRRSLVKSEPLSLPPRMRTIGRSKLSIALSVASTVVAFESLTNATPPHGQDALQPVLEAVERPDGFPDRPGRDAEKAGGQGRGQDVFPVVEAGQPDVGDRQDRPSPSVVADDDPAVAEEAAAAREAASG